MLMSPRTQANTDVTVAGCDDAHELIDVHRPVAHGPSHECARPGPPQPLAGSSSASADCSITVEAVTFPPAP